MVERTGARAQLRIHASNVLLLGGALLVSIVIGECGARISSKIAPSPRIYPGERQDREGVNFVLDPVTGWRMRSNHRFQWTIDGIASSYVSDGDGYRTWEIEPQWGGSMPRRRIVLLGDSFTFGTGVDYAQTFGALIESSSTAVENRAMPGFGIDQMWTALDRTVFDLDPDLVVVLFIDEDFDRSLTSFRTTEGLSKPTFVLDRDRLRPLRADDRPHALWRWFETNSWLWSATQELARSSSYWLPIGDWWALNRALLASMVERCRDENIPLLLVRLPLRHPKPFPALEKEMRALGAHYLDLCSEAPDVDGPIHFPIDSHIDARGHRWVADQLRKAPVAASILR